MVRIYLQNGLEFPVDSLLIMAILFDIQDSKSFYYIAKLSIHR
jgi:hypothetical protein